MKRIKIRERRFSFRIRGDGVGIREWGLRFRGHGLKWVTGAQAKWAWLEFRLRGAARALGLQGKDFNSSLNDRDLGLSGWGQRWTGCGSKGEGLVLVKVVVVLE